VTQAIPRLSVIMPAHEAAQLLPDTLAALAGSTLPRPDWELIVVDDGSTDQTSVIASHWADHVITLPAPARGPGGARNAGAAVARGAWLMFVDADVRVHADALQRVVDAVSADPGLDAIFGAYDAKPEARGLVSEYRNLLHRYTHCVGAGEAETFWAGCGAVRRDAFARIGGFDTVRFPRPQIEDIDLGYRLRDAGGRIVLDPTIEGTHLKRWTLRGMLRTDLLDRGIPWMRLLLERRDRTAAAAEGRAGGSGTGARHRGHDLRRPPDGGGVGGRMAHPGGEQRAHVPLVHAGARTVVRACDRAVAPRVLPEQWRGRGGGDCRPPGAPALTGAGRRVSDRLLVHRARGVAFSRGPACRALHPEQVA
jgi:hypothetical protein